MSGAPRTIRHRNWGPNTLNNYTDEHLRRTIEFCKVHCKTWVVAEEMGESGTPHLQFSFTLNFARSLAGLAKDLPFGTHLEVTKDVVGAFEYCGKPSKKGTVGKVYRSEAAPTRAPGSRTDISRVYASWRAGTSRDEFLESEPSWSNIKLFDVLNDHTNTKRDIERQKHVIWFYGGSGSGKTTVAKRLMAGTPHYLVDTADWRPYNRERILFFDDIRKHYCEPRELLRIADWPPYIANVKYGHKALFHDTVVVTNIDHPETFWTNNFPKEPVDQWMRRITKIVKVDNADQAYEEAKEFFAHLNEEAATADAEMQGGEEEAKSET